MKKEVKFRSWYKLDLEKGIHIPFYTNLHSSDVVKFEYQALDILHPITYDVGLVLGDTNWIIEQYTGLTDKNGRDIYEGDIVKIVHPFRGRTHIGEVIWEDYRFNIRKFYFTHFDYPSEAFSEGTEYIEVIGNIYENIDLLEV